MIIIWKLNAYSFTQAVLSKLFWCYLIVTMTKRIYHSKNTLRHFMSQSDTKVDASFAVKHPNGTKNVFQIEILIRVSPRYQLCIKISKIWGNAVKRVWRWDGDNFNLIKSYKMSHDFIVCATSSFLNPMFIASFDSTSSTLLPKIVYKKITTSTKLIICHWIV
jgi:hypothetical protein